MHASRYLIIVAALGAFVAGAYASTATVEKAPHYTLPAWDQQFKSAANRFIVLSNWASEAVLDNETGLVWETSPSTSVETWTGALAACRVASTGGRYGWRLPQQEELASLGVPDSGNALIPDLPTGNPFQNAAGDFFWTATALEHDTTKVWAVSFGTAINAFVAKTGTSRFWCVRGGHGAQNPQ